MVEAPPNGGVVLLRLSLRERPLFRAHRLRKHDAPSESSGEGVGRRFERPPRISTHFRLLEVVELEKLRTPVLVNAVYLLLLGLITLSPSMVGSVFGYAVQDQGVLRVLSATLLGLGVLVWAIAGNVGKYGGLAMNIVIADVIGAVWLLWGWAGHLFTLRNAGVPIVINVVLAAWVWSARPKS